MGGHHLIDLFHLPRPYRRAMGTGCRPLWPKAHSNHGSVMHNVLLHCMGHGYQLDHGYSYPSYSRR